jgi:Methyltransferase domain
LLRDRGLDARTIDEHATPTYARSFEGALTDGYDLITAFEVFEHFPNPSESVAHLFQVQPRIIIASTEIYSGQDSNWWYLGPQHGQHVFFYSSKALHWLAAQHGYSYYIINGRHLFAKQPLTRCRLWAISRLSSGRLFQIFRATLPLSESWNWVVRDFQSLSGGKLL